MKKSVEKKLPAEDDRSIEDIILKIRGENVILASDLAKLFGVETKRLNEQVKRNSKRFPADFMFQLTEEEFLQLVANCDRFANLKHSSARPYVFTEHGALQAANVLNSEQAIEMSVYIVRAFVAMRRMTGAMKELADKVAELEQQFGKHDKVLQILSRVLLSAPAKTEPLLSPQRKIGFNSKAKDLDQSGTGSKK